MKIEQLNVEEILQRVKKSDEEAYLIIRSLQNSLKLHQDVINEATIKLKNRGVRSEEEIREVISRINSNQELTYGYREDCTDVLNWVLGKEPFDGL